MSAPVLKSPILPTSPIKTVTLLANVNTYNKVTVASIVAVLELLLTREEPIKVDTMVYRVLYRV